MQISLYIGERKKKDHIVNEELLKYVEGDRSDRIKDLILKGLIFEGKTDIDEKLLDMRYLYEKKFTVSNNKAHYVQKNVEDKPSFSNIKNKEIEDVKPDFTNIKIDKKDIIDDELEERI